MEELGKALSSGFATAVGGIPGMLISQGMSHILGNNDVSHQMMGHSQIAQAATDNSMNRLSSSSQHGASLRQQYSINAMQHNQNLQAMEYGSRLRMREREHQAQLNSRLMAEEQARVNADPASIHNRGVLNWLYDNTPPLFSPGFNREVTKTHSPWYVPLGE